MWKRAICNEMFGKMEFALSCDLIKQQGFQGMEIAPFTISDEQGIVSDATISMVEQAFKDFELEFAGLHWLFAFPPGLEVNATDKAKRDQAMAHLKHLLDLSGALGGGPLIFGSPKQRHVADGDVKAGLERFEEFLREAAPYAEKNNSVICLEALPASNTNIMNTLAEAVHLVEKINHPSISTMFDFHNCDDETLPFEVLVDNYFPMIKHVHLNDLDGNHPTEKDIESFLPTFEVLRKRNYQRWVSMEIFTVPENPAEILDAAREFLDIMEAQTRA